MEDFDLTKNKIVYGFFLLFIMIIIGCSTQENNLKQESPYAVILTSDTEKNIIIINNQFEMIERLKLGIYIRDIDTYGKYLFALDTGDDKNPRRDLYRLDLLDFSFVKMELPHIPHQLFVSHNIAYVSSSSPAQQGFYLMAIDTTNLKLIDVTVIPGMSTSFVADKDKVYVAINSGGAHNFGKYAKILDLKVNENNSIEYDNIMQTEEELPPSAMKIVDDKIVGIYPGFSRGPKPKWVISPEKYTNKMKMIDIKTGKVVDQVEFSTDFPQNISVKDDKITFINHYTDLDMSGDQITVYDLQTKQLIKRIETSTPSSLAVDKKYLLVTNKVTDKLTIFDVNSFKEIKQLKVGKWPLKVKLFKAYISLKPQNGIGVAPYLVKLVIEETEWDFLCKGNLIPSNSNNN